MPPRRNRRRRPRGARRPGRFIFFLLVLALAVGAYELYHLHLTGTAAHRHRGAQPAEIANASPAPAPSGSQPTPESSNLPAPFPSRSPGPSKLAIIIDDCGYNVARCEQFFKLPIPLTFSILPMTPYARQIADDAVAADKSIILHLPMEPLVAGAHDDPGPGVITTSMSDAQVQSQVDEDLASLPPVPGANNHMGSKATADARVMRDVLEVFKRDHEFFIDSRTSPQSVGLRTARELGIPTAARDVFLDNQATVPYVESQLDVAQRTALAHGTAIAIGHPNDATAQALAALIPQMQAAGVTFVPAADLVK